MGFWRTRAHHHYMLDSPPFDVPSTYRATHARTAATPTKTPAWHWWRDIHSGGPPPPLPRSSPGLPPLPGTLFAPAGPLVQLTWAAGRAGGACHSPTFLARQHSCNLYTRHHYQAASNWPSTDRTDSMAGGQDHLLSGSGQHYCPGAGVPGFPGQGGHPALGHGEVAACLTRSRTGWDVQAPSVGARQEGTHSGRAGLRREHGQRQTFGHPATNRTNTCINNDKATTGWRTSPLRAGASTFDTGGQPVADGACCRCSLGPVLS